MDSPASSKTFQMMENSLEKLRCLDYETHFVRKLQKKPISREEFSIPAFNTSLQFAQFIDICSWLVSVITHQDDALKIDQYDDPNTIISKLLLFLGRIGFESDFPANRLKQPYGEATTAVLDFLTDKALETRGFIFQQPKYVTEDSKEVDAGDDDEIIDEAESHNNEDDESIDMFSDVYAENGQSETQELSNQIIDSNIDPVEWRTELERVGSRLQDSTGRASFIRSSLHYKIKVRFEPGGEEWRDHLNQTKRHEHKINESFPSAEECLQMISRDLSLALERIETKESNINEQFHELSQEYDTVRKSQRDMEETHVKTSANVDNLSKELGTIVDQVDKIKVTMDKKGQSMTDTTPLVQIKTALQKLKAENRAFDLQIGVLEHTLLQSRLQKANPQEDSMKEDTDAGTEDSSFEADD